MREALTNLLKPCKLPSGRINWRDVEASRCTYPVLASKNIRQMQAFLDDLHQQGAPATTRAAMPDEIIQKIADGFALERLVRPLDNFTALLTEVAAPLWEGAVTPKSIEKIREAIEESWKVVLDVQTKPVIVEREVQTPINLAHVLRSTPLHQLCSIAVERLLQETFKANGSPGSSNSDPVARTQPPPQVQPIQQARKQKIIVLGMRTKDHKIITEKVEAAKPNRYEVKCVEHSTSNQIPHADRIIVSRFCRHTGWDKMRERFGTKVVEFVDGGVSAIVDKILTL